MLEAFGKVLRMGERKRLEQLAEIVEAVNALEPEVQRMSDAELLGRHGAVSRDRIRGGSPRGAAPEAFAAGERRR